MPTPKQFNLKSVDDLLTPEQCVQWMQLKNERALMMRYRRGDIPGEKFGHGTILFWPRRILLKNGADPKILSPMQVNGRRTKTV